MPTLDDPRRWIHRQLPLRLGLATLALILAGGALSYGFEASRQTRALLDDARTRLALLVRETGERIESRGEDAPTAFFGVFERHFQDPVSHPLGRFVVVRFFSPEGKGLRTFADPQLAQADALTQALGKGLPARPAAGETWSQDWRQGGREFARLVLPISDQKARVHAYVDALFRFGPRAIAERGAEALRGTGLVVLAILVTVLLIYPLVKGLLGRLEAFAARLQKANLDTLRVMGTAIAKRDSDTDAHNYRVALYALALGEKLDLPTREMQALIKGAFLHDVGKIGIPDRILHKPGRLNEAEFAVMRTHVAQGLEIISASAWLEDAAAVVGGHHEKVAGTGYPAGLRGRDIPRVARIFAIADVFDALASERPYKAAVPLDKTLAILREGAGNHFDVGFLEIFLGLAADLHARYAQAPVEVLRKALQAQALPWFEG